MRILRVVLAAGILLFTTQVVPHNHDAHAAACKTTGRCNACSSCRYCKPCAKEGMTCSVCR